MVSLNFMTEPKTPCFRRRFVRVAHQRAVRIGEVAFVAPAAVRRRAAWRAGAPPILASSTAFFYMPTVLRRPSRLLKFVA
jgi:hypothetical protein